jgi:hypothetical protein
MRSSLMAQVFIGILCGSTVLLAGCGNPPPQALASLTVAATPSTLSVGGTSALKATAHLSDGTTQDVTSGTQWVLSNPALAKMSSGTLTASAPGTISIQATYVEATPAGNSPAAANASPETLNASTQLTITASPSASTPTITWPTPTPITYGTVLGSTQLNATANVPGTFSYSPAAGTLLKAGMQTLSVVFTPGNTAS